VFPLKSRVTANPYLNVRVGPGLGYKPVRRLDCGTSVDILEIKDKWARIAEGEWCSTDWLSPQ
jgi:uncharacterized protein YgiM (DUF1202 family)